MCDAALCKSTDLSLEGWMLICFIMVFLALRDVLEPGTRRDGMVRVMARDMNYSLDELSYFFFAEVFVGIGFASGVFYDVWWLFANDVSLQAYDG